MSALGCKPGVYFHKKTIAWVKRAQLGGSGVSLKSEFVVNYSGQVIELHSVLGKLQGCFSIHGEPLADEITKRAEEAWRYLMDGTWGLCAADPSCERGIVQKEILQEQLIAASNNGADPSAASLSKSELLALIDRYASAAMPFCPIEYPVSSRRRLVDDLRKQLG
jgi:Family of unknown function (DUF6058)